MVWIYQSLVLPPKQPMYLCFCTSKRSLRSRHHGLLPEFAILPKQECPDAYGGDKRKTWAQWRGESQRRAGLDGSTLPRTQGHQRKCGIWNVVGHEATLDWSSLAFAVRIWKAVPTWTSTPECASSRLNVSYCSCYPLREQEHKPPTTPINHVGLAFDGIISHHYIQVDLASGLPAEKFLNLEQIFTLKQEVWLSARADSKLIPCLCFA